MKHHRALSRPNAVYAQSGLEVLLAFLTDAVNSIIAIIYLVSGGKVGR